MAHIRDYTIRYYGGATGLQGIHAQAHLFGADNHLLGWLNFRTDGMVLPDSKQTQIVLEFPISVMPGIISMLRDESPVYVYWQEKLGMAYFGTGQEHVGEGEKQG